MKKWLWIVLILGVAGACLDDPDCLKTADTALIINFKRLEDGKTDTLRLYSISAAGADSIFYKSEPEELDTLMGVVLAVNPFTTETSFTFLFESGEKHLTVGYKTEARFISEDCGSEQSQYDLSVILTDFDSVRVVNTRLTTSRLTNIEIFN